MKIALITHVPHTIRDSRYYAYGPYVKEMNLWFNYVDTVLLVAPVQEGTVSAIDLPYQHSEIRLREVSAFSLLSAKEILKTITYLPRIIRSIYLVMRDADHIHLRCPGNMGLVACFVQILFPKKNKTAKYAGNWDPNSKQPWSYRLQKWILSNTILTRNMKVLVYGQWEGASRNIVSFFTATYRDSDKKEVPLRTLDTTIRFLFVGTLSKGKRPLYAVQLVEALLRSGCDVHLELFGEGAERENLERYIRENGLQQHVVLHGNREAEIVEEAYRKSHFLILPSQSEGWPKVVAEAMFWGCVPVATKVSCVPSMLDNGKRGILLALSIEADRAIIQQCVANPLDYQDKAKQGMEWSRQFTLDYFESEIQKMLKKQ